MAKLGWTLCHRPESLAKQYVVSKYVPKDYVTKFNRGSHIWQGVGKGWSLLESSCLWIIGNGEMASLWLDNWLGLGRLEF